LMPNMQGALMFIRTSTAYLTSKCGIGGERN
jgi:hypothetical protein